MSVIVFAESAEGNFKKAVFEACTYANKVAEQMGTDVTAICASNQLPSDDALAALGNYGVNKTVKVQLEADRPAAIAEAIAQLAQNESAQVVVLSQNYAGKSIAPIVGVKMKAAVATGVVSLPDTASGFKVRRGVFSGKAFADVNLTATNKVLAITPNTFTIEEHGGSASVEELASPSNDSAYRVKATETDKVKGKIPLTEAELVVSAGRGMKGPENWGMIEELAETLGAATACSKPVSDMDWRPHEEHVGQTGITIKPNLYMAIGISGAIQHLAGVSSSKVIVAINKDPEAPFFKSADYGIVGDAFEVVPKLIEAAKEFKAAQ